MTSLIGRGQRRLEPLMKSRTPDLYKTISEVVHEQTDLSEEELDAALDAKKMTVT